MFEYNLGVDGLNVRVIEEGQGPPMLLLHGGTVGFSADMWRPTMPPLGKAGWRVIAYDQPGYAHSDDPPDFALNYRQTFTAKVLDAMRIEKAAVVGHSQAGGFAVSLALEQANSVSAVVVLGTGSLLPPQRGTQGKEAAVPTNPPTREDTLRLLQANLFHHELITPVLLEDYHRLCIGRHFTNAVKRTKHGLSASQGTPLWQRLGEVSVPMLLMYGEQDRGSPAERLSAARERAPQATFELIQDCHHIVQWDQPDVFVKSTLAFLNRIAADQPRTPQTA
jgi:pimeloyl-ACP methyl ester carboxylesterase